MKGFGSFVTVFSSVLTLVGASNVVDLDSRNFDKEILKGGRPALVEFFAPWCGHCKTLAPIYEQLADSFVGQKDKVTIGKVDADNHKSLGKRFGVSGFPTLKWFDGKSDQPIPYEGGRDLESLQAFVTEKLGVKPKIKKEVPSDVKAVTDADFDKIVLDLEKDVLVEFYAPWCGHCKALAPIYEIIATNFKDEPTVVIAKLNADSPAAKGSAERYGVTGYPTLKFFPKGSTEPIDFNEGRSESEIVNFINKHAGTHRAIGGGLKETAGRIAALDAIVNKLVKGDETKAVEELKKAAEGLKEKYAAYYVKAIGKIQKNAVYVEKELKRLEGIAKSGLAPSKHDDLTIRKNILKQFYAGESPVKAKDEL